MCGIAGILSLAPARNPVEEPLLLRMRDRLEHRGPDGKGAWIDSNRRIGLGHRRLSIIDLSEAATQPMSNEDDTLWITFNGEIYNHADIRRELEATGRHQWKTDHSDTEVILHAFEEWGIDCLARFRGMFAFALWDTRKQELWLVRDRMGIKPLYYSLHHNRLIFASEIKALLEDPELPRSIDRRSFHHFLSFMATPAPDTMFEQIKKLPNATWMRFRADGSREERRYWDIYDDAPDDLPDDETALAERLLAELRESVQLRKVSDVPVGVFLSGGIDSSVNTALFSEGETNPVKTFTIGYDHDYASYQNECDFAKVMAERVGAEYHERILSLDDLIDFLPRLVELQDEPIADPVCIPVFFVSELARKHGVTVCQVGEGADELFCGYPYWNTFIKLQQRFNHPGSRLAAMPMLALMRLFGKQNGYHYEWMRRGSCGLPVFWSGAESYTETQKAAMLSDDMKKDFGKESPWESLKPIRARFEARAPEPTPLQWMSYVDLNFRLPELLLMRIDKMSMGVGLECRVPFLDHQFASFAMQIPQSTKIRNGELKHILKRAVTGVIPDELIYRKKQGFGVPLKEWFLERLGKLADQEIRQFCRSTGLLKEDEAAAMLRGPYPSRSWYLYNFALWAKHNELG